MVKLIEENFEDIEQIVTFPTIKQNIWRIVITTPSRYYVGHAENGQITILDEFVNKPINTRDPIVEKALEDHNIKAFLSFSPVYRYDINYHDEYTELRFTDLRYRHNGRYPFVAIVQIDDEHGEDLEILDSYTGWVFSEEKLQDKLSPGES